MKKILLLALTLLLTPVIAQTGAPTGYYSSATGTGYTLKTQLYNIIKDHTQVSYSNLLSNMYRSNSNINAFRDKYYENDNTILDIYSEKPTSADPYTFGMNENCGTYTYEGDCFNREHLIPQSYFNSQSPMYSDAFHVWPTDGKVNGWRSNFPFGVVAGNTNPCNSGANNTPCHSQNGSKKGNNLNSGYSAGYSGTVFEPIDEFKGDVARAFFYFVTRYENKMSSFYNNNTGVRVMFDGTNNKAFNTTFLNILYQWHIQDPVSQREIDLNNFVYSFQGNRNPYIDHPEFVGMIWGLGASVEDVDPVYVSVYPNPSNDNQINIASDNQIDTIILYNLNGQIIQKINKPAPTSDVITINELPKGFYLLQIGVENQTLTKKVIIN